MDANLQSAGASAGSIQADGPRRTIDSSADEMNRSADEGLRRYAEAEKEFRRRSSEEFRQRIAAEPYRDLKRMAGRILTKPLMKATVGKLLQRLGYAPLWSLPAADQDLTVRNRTMLELSCTPPRMSREELDRFRSIHSCP